MSIKQLSFKTLLILLSISLLVPACGKQHKRDTKTNVAYVSDSPISRQELDAEMSRLKQRFYNTTKSEKQNEQMKKEVLEILIGGKILYMSSQDKGIKVTSQEIDAGMDKTRKDYPDTEKFKNNFTKSDIKQKIAIDKFITMEFADTTVISDDDSKKYYNANIDDFTRPAKVLASHILIKTSRKASQEEKDAAMQKIEEVQKKLQNGADFAELAKEYSDDKSKDNGGSLGYFMKGQMVKPFEEAAFKLGKDEVSDIVTTEFGYHIIKVEDKKPAVIIPYKDVEAKLKTYLKQRAIQAKIEKFIADKRKALKIETYL
jgi:peptidyl-prolyl cis-trans isomerase C